MRSTHLYIVVLVSVIISMITVSGLSAQTVELFTTPGSHTFIVPAGVSQITVEAWGGGGAGGGANNGRGGGGAGGCYVKSTFDVTPGESFSFQVAAEKTATITSTAIQNKGNYSWFGSTSLLLADGGNGGGPGGNGTAGTGGLGISVGTTRYAGGSGNAGNNGAGGGGAGSLGNGGNANNSIGGLGRSEFGGDGGDKTSNNSDGLPGVNYGGGGSGAHSNNSNQQRAGGTGAQGMIRITYTGANPLAGSATTTSTCQGVTPATGTITITATGGTPPYQYSLSGGSFQSSGTFIGLSAGTYYVVIKDLLNTQFQINNILVLEDVSTMPDLTANVIPASCGQADGSITITNIPTPVQLNKADADYIDLGTSILNNLSQFTIEGWVKLDKSLISGDRTWGLFGQNDAIEFGIMNNTTLQLWTSSGGTLNVAMSLYPDDNSWHHIAGVGTGSQMMIYIDGNIAGSLNNTTSNYGSSNFHTVIGGHVWDATGNYLNGSILKTSFWSRALSVSEIQQLVSSQFAQYSADDDGLITGFNYFEGAGSSISGTGSTPVTASLINSPTWVEEFTYSWSKQGDPSFTAFTKNIAMVGEGQYSIVASFTGMCPATGTWTIGNSGLNYWTGSIDTDWNKSGNWTCTIPDLTLDAVIPSGLSRYPVLGNGSTGLCKDISIQSGSSVIITSGTLQIAGAIQNAGVFDATQGTIVLRGTAAQSIPANAFAGNAVGNLTISNSAGVSLNGTLYVYGVLYAQAGNFQTNGHLTLLSTPLQTALIDGSGAGEVLGNVTIQRFILSSFGYKYFSSPFTSITVSEYADYIDLNAEFPAFYYYNENQVSTGWEAYTALAGVLSPGTGYALNFGTAGTPVSVSATGIVNNGTIGPITLFNHNEPFTKGFNLIGNPYPSPVDWNAPGWTKTNIDNALYFFESGTTNQYQGSYSTYINGISSNGTAGNLIPAQQGFFIHVSDGTYPVQGTLTFTNSVRVTNLTAPFHKNTDTDSRSLIRLSARNESSENTDYTVVYFDDYASAEFNPDLDALKLMNTDAGTPNLYSIGTDERNTSVKSIQFPVYDTYVVDLAVSSKSECQITIKAEQIKNLPSGYRVYLKDSYTGRIQDLLTVPEYTFSMSGESFTDRFRLIISRVNLSQEALGTNSFNAYVKEGSVYLNLRLKEEQVMVHVSDLTGRTVLQATLYGDGNHQLGRIEGNGIYIVSIYTDMGIISKKVYLN